MGIKRGNFESVGLGALAKGINPNYHHHASVAGGLGALASGMRAYAEGWDAIADGLRAWGGLFTDLGKKAVDADKQQKYNEQMASQAQEELDRAIASEGLTENDEKFWHLRDEAARWKDRAEHQSIFGVSSSPQPTRQYRKQWESEGVGNEEIESRLDKRRKALSPKDEDGNPLKSGDRGRKYGFGGIQSWDAEVW